MSSITLSPCPSATHFSKPWINSNICLCYAFNLAPKEVIQCIKWRYWKFASNFQFSAASFLHPLSVLALAHQRSYSKLSFTSTRHTALSLSFSKWLYQAEAVKETENTVGILTEETEYRKWLQRNWKAGKAERKFGDNTVIIAVRNSYRLLRLWKQKENKRNSHFIHMAHSQCLGI